MQELQHEFAAIVVQLNETEVLDEELDDKKAQFEVRFAFGMPRRSRCSNAQSFGPLAVFKARSYHAMQHHPDGLTVPCQRDATVHSSARADSLHHGLNVCHVNVCISHILQLALSAAVSTFHSCRHR